MATLQDLLDSVPGYLQSQILDPQQQEAKRQQMLQYLMPSLLSQYGKTAQNIAENSFGKGMGLSSWAAMQQAENAMNQNLAAGQLNAKITNDMDAARQAAIGNAASYAAGAEGRAAQERMNSANNATRMAYGKQQIGGAKSIQNSKNLWEGLVGLGKGAGGLGMNILGSKGPGNSPSMIDKASQGIQGLFAKPQVEPLQEKGIAPGEGPMPSANAVPSPSYDFGASAPSAPSFNDFSSYYGDTPSFGDFGGGDFSSFYGQMPSLDNLLNFNDLENF